MSSHSRAARVELTTSYRDRGRPERRHSVRVALVTWPIIVCLGATVAAAACLIGDCSHSRKRTATEARETRVSHTGTVQSVAFRADGAVLSSVGIDGSIVIWGHGGFIEHPFLPDGPGQVRSAAFSTDNRVLATANLNEPVALHDLAGRTFADFTTRPRSTRAAACLAFAPDGSTLAVGQQDGRITLWDPRTACKVGAARGPCRFRRRARVFARWNNHGFVGRRSHGANLGHDRAARAICHRESRSNVWNAVNFAGRAPACTGRPREAPWCASGI